MFCLNWQPSVTLNFIILDVEESFRGRLVFTTILTLESAWYTFPPSLLSFQRSTKYIH